MTLETPRWSPVEPKEPFGPVWASKGDTIYQFLSSMLIADRCWLRRWHAPPGKDHIRSPFPLQSNSGIAEL